MEEEKRWKIEEDNATAVEEREREVGGKLNLARDVTASGNAAAAVAAAAAATSPR